MNAKLVGPTGLCTRWMPGVITIDENAAAGKAGEGTRTRSGSRRIQRHHTDFGGRCSESVSSSLSAGACRSESADGREGVAVAAGADPHRDLGAREGGGLAMDD